MSKPRPDLSAGRSKRTRQTAGYPAGWGQMVELNAVMGKDADQTKHATDKLFQVSLVWNTAMQTGQGKNSKCVKTKTWVAQAKEKIGISLYILKTYSHRGGREWSEKWCTEFWQYKGPYKLQKNVLHWWSTWTCFFQVRTVEFTWYKSAIVCRSKRELWII